ncbi:hypothetical protein PUR71_37095 [Streptomyces sp. SP17BM10]|uniref:hypothetical protein n=1 Tax=Streptomyces sp. SP17BM10 TaxID=3002530 RepID=UPI002E781095|nr:hypothetical protein [Streptomyces sp. SP17BM10]MEE1788477.1 hypothetical protein [Streptomyces sp. SP17BM10]
MRSTTRTAGAAGLLLAVGVAGLAGVTTAQASTPVSDRTPRAAATPTTVPTRAPGPNFVLCSKGTYSSYAVFPKRGNMATHEVPAGGCTSLRLDGIADEQVVLYGIGPGGARFRIATDTFDDRDGERIRTLGTPDADDWTTF